MFSLANLYLKVIAAFVLIFFALSLTVRALGEGQPAHPALRGFTEGCEGRPQPCWYGIVPGVTTAAETTRILESQGYRFAYQSDRSYTLSFRHDTSPIFRIDFEALCSQAQGEDCHSNPLLWLFVFTRNTDLSVGDILLTLGLPERIGFNPVFTNPALFYNGLEIAVRDWVYPWHQAGGFEFFRSLEDVSRAAPWRAFSAWHGFTPLWRYCQLEPELPEFVCE